MFEKVFQKGQVFTVPNLLSLFRLILIPFIVVYYFTGPQTVAIVLIAVSAFTDVIDGRIARRFHMISNLGKILDPLADKLTEGAHCWSGLPLQADGRSVLHHGPAGILHGVPGHAGSEAGHGHQRTVVRQGLHGTGLRHGAGPLDLQDPHVIANLMICVCIGVPGLHHDHVHRLLP